MKVLISPASIDEARLAFQSDADIIDVKNPAERSLGANFPWIIKEICDINESDVLISATIGDLDYKPGMAALAAHGVACCGVNYIKAGLYDMKTYEQAYDVMSAVTRAIRMENANAIVVTAGYADYDRFGGLNQFDLIRAARDSGADVVMLDTAIKDGSTLFDNLSFDEVTQFIKMGHDFGLKVALAGSLQSEDVRILGSQGADIVGVRGAVCEDGDRNKGISLLKIHELMKFV